MTRDELLSRIGSQELTEWLAFDQEYGLPDAYFVVAQLARAILAPWSKRPVEVGDFVPYFASPRRRQSTADHRAFFEAISRRRV